MGEGEERVKGKVEKRERGEGGSQLGDRLQDKGSARAEILASPSNRQGVRAPGACHVQPSTGHLSCRSISALAGRVRALSWAGYVAHMYHEHF